MDKNWTISLKDSKLRKIRTELRTLLVRKVEKRIGYLTKEQSDLRKNRPSDDEKFYRLHDELEDQKNKLRRQKKASICSCATCSDMEKDHAFNMNTKEWYCEKCYGKLKKG